jgi:acyl-CoA synthetase (AMP-forming)/AMP-acid ligase II
MSSVVPSLDHILIIENSNRRVDLAEFPRLLRYEPLLEHYCSQHLDFSAKLNAEEMINIQFTSGTTSTPKAACLSHSNVLNNALFVGRGMELNHQDVICCPPPLYHCFGLVLGVLTSMLYG